MYRENFGSYEKMIHVVKKNYIVRAELRFIQRAIKVLECCKQVTLVKRILNMHCGVNFMLIYLIGQQKAKKWKRMKVMMNQLNAFA